MQLRTTAILAALTFAGLALGACHDGKPPGDGAPPEPPDVAANFAQPIDARAADSSWSLKIRSNQLTLSRYGQADLAVTAPGAMIEPHQSTWIADMPDHEKLTVKVYASPCVYPSTTENHPFAAEVDLPNAPPLSGCGDPAGAAKPAAAPAKR